MKILKDITMYDKIIITLICLSLSIITVKGSIPFKDDFNSGLKNIESVQGDSIKLPNQIYVPFNTNEKEVITGAVTVIDPAGLHEVDFETDVNGILRGRIPGSTGGLNLRGLGEALVVIDGLPRPITSVRADEIEQITVIRDANAALLYGSQSRNGVILITTKRGKINSRNFNVSAEHGYSKAVKLPNYLNAADYMLLYNEARTNDGLTPLYSNTEIENTRNRVNPIRFPDADYYSSEFLRNYKPTTKVVAEFSDGREFAQYYVNAGFTQSGSYIDMGEGQNEHDQRFNVRSNINFKINDNIKSYVGIAAIYDISRSANGNFWADASTLRPNLYPPLIDTSMVPGHLALKESATLIDGRYLLGGTSNYLNNVWGNLNFGGYSTMYNTAFQFNTGVEFDLKSILNGLTLKSGIALDYYNQYTELQNNTYAVYEPQWPNGNNNQESLSLIKRGVDKFEGTQGISDPNVIRNMGFNGVLDYSRIFPKHAISVSALAYGEIKNQTGLVQPYKNTHLGSKINYMYNNRYILDLNGVLVNSTKLHSSNRIGFSPSVGLGWILSNEDFLSGSSTINYLKLKATASRLHTDVTIPEYYLFDSRYAPSGHVSWNDNTRSLPAYELLFEKNYDLFFEVREEVNFGFDALLFNRSLLLDVNVFSTNIKDMVTQRTSVYSDYLGGVYPYENYGENAYQGVEAGITWNANFSRNFGLNVGSSVTLLQSEVIVRDELYEYDYLYRKGNPVNAIFGYEAQGLFASNEDIQNHVPQSFGEVRPGDIKYKDQNNDGVIDANDQVFLGNYTPDIIGSLHLTLRYKNLSLFALASGYTGSHGIMNSNYYWVYGDRKYSEVVLDRWNETNLGGTYPRLSTTSSSNNYRNSSFWLYDASRITIDRVQLTYNIPENAGGILSNMRLYLRASNVAMFSANKDIMELNVGSQPQSRYYAIGINARF